MEVLSSIYCREGEAEVVDRSTVRIALTPSSHLSLAWPGPSLSLSSPLTRATSEEVVEGLRAGLVEDEGDMVALVEQARAVVLDRLEQSQGEVEVTKEVVEVMMVKLDHMRDVANYLKTLDRWVKELCVRMVVVMSKDRGIVAVVEGAREDLGVLMARWKTTNIDVDSRGRPCKERMMAVVGREVVGEVGVMEGQVVGEEGVMEGGQAFRVVRVDRFLEGFQAGPLRTILRGFWQ